MGQDSCEYCRQHFEIPWHLFEFRLVALRQDNFVDFKWECSEFCVSAARVSCLAFSTQISHFMPAGTRSTVSSCCLANIDLTRAILDAVESVLSP